MLNDDSARETRQLVPVEGLRLEDSQLAEQLYTSAGLNPVVEAGLKDYDKRLQKEDKVINKVLGPRASDIKGYGEAVAKRVALAVYGMLNQQYGGKMGDLRSYILTLEDERDRANSRYDELMGRAVGILGEEYKELRTDSNTFMERLTTVLGDDLKQSRLDQGVLAEKLADIDGLREQVRSLTEEKARIQQGFEVRTAEMGSTIQRLEADNVNLKAEVAHLDGVRQAVTRVADNLGETVPHVQIAESMDPELYEYLLRDSRVPRTVLDGVGKFIDFKKYLRLAVERGSEEAARQSAQQLSDALAQ